jgi:mono/diheme cytochrome c family protein
MSATRVLVAAVIVVAASAIVAFLWASRYPEIAAIEPPERSAFDPELIEKGEALTGLGDCIVCHTGPRGEPFAGGLELQTPFGVIYSTNITPNADTGIGVWSEEAFRRAMHEGIDREGNYLYPAFPYNHFTKVMAEDVRAIYAYMMTRRPVDATPPANKLRFPFNIRMLVGGWNLLFLDRSRYTPDPSQDDEWNRGAYLVQGLGHCGACHTPRNAFGAEKLSQRFAGGEAEGWEAPALLTVAPDRIPWVKEPLVNYLFDGWDEKHGIAAGPMAPVVNQLYEQSEDDVFAMAAYLASMQDTVPSAEASERAVARARRLEWGENEVPNPADTPDEAVLQRGEQAFFDQCATCHKEGTGSAQPVLLALTVTLHAPDPRNIIHIIFDGIRPPLGAVRRSMPGFGAAITDTDIADLLIYIRWRFTDLPPWNDVRARVDAKRASW